MADDRRPPLRLFAKWHQVEPSSRLRIITKDHPAFIIRNTELPRMWRVLVLFQLERGNDRLPGKCPPQRGAPPTDERLSIEDILPQAVSGEARTEAGQFDDRPRLKRSL